MLTRGPQQPVRVILVLQEGGPVDKCLGRVPDDVADGLLRVDPEHVLKDGEEGNLLGRVLNPVVHGVEHVEGTREVDVVGPVRLRLVALPLLLEHVQLDGEVRVGAGGLELADNLQQLQA